MAGKNIKKIIVGVDGSEHSMHAVNYAASLFHKEKVEVVLYHTLRNINDAFFDMGINPIEGKKLVAIETWKAAQKQAVEKIMDDACGILSDSGIPRDSIKIKIHSRKTGIARDFAKEIQAGYSAVFIGRKGVSKVKSLILGNVSFKLLQMVTHIPVWAIGSPMKSKKILVALDNSEGSMHAVDYFGKILANSDFPIILVNVIRGVELFMQESRELKFPDYEKLENEIKKVIEPVMEEAKNRLTDAGVKPSLVSTKIITGAHSRAEAIVSEAKKEKCGTIVVGRRGLSNLEEFRMGRVANKILHIAGDMNVCVVN